MAQQKNRPTHPGIEVRHQRDCGSRHGRRCSCVPGYRAQVWSPQDDAALRQTFRSLSEAKAWRAEAQVQIRKGLLRAPEPVTLSEAAETWLAGAREGRIRNRSGDRYKPSALRGYEQALRLRVLPELGATRLDRIQRADLQDLVERMLGAGCGPSTIRNTLLPVRAICRRALARGRIAVNPTQGLEMPAVRSAYPDRLAARG